MGGSGNMCSVLVGGVRSHMWVGMGGREADAGNAGSARAHCQRGGDGGAAQQVLSTGSLLLSGGLAHRR